MRILDIHQFFAGPESPGPDQPRAFVRTLAARGHQVDVLACDFNAYNEQTETTEHWTDPSGGTVTVHRLPAPRNMRASLRNRLLTYMKFAWAAWRYGRGMQRPDVVLASIQPLFAGYAGLKLARRWNVPVLIEVRDLWPDALVAKGAISRLQSAPLERLARSLYFGADRLVSLTPGIRRELIGKGVDAEKIDLFPNGYRAPDLHNTTDSRLSIRKEYGWDEKFVAVFTGAHTEVTAVDVIVRAGALLKSRPDIRIDLFGAGQTKSNAVALSKQLGLDNVHFHDAVPKSRVPRILAGADVALMTLFQSPLIHIYFESKLIDYMGAAKPILAAMDGLQATLIERLGAGRTVPSLDHEGLARLIIDACNRQDELQPMAAAGNAFIREHLAQDLILGRYAERLESMASGTTTCEPAWDPLGL